MENYSNFSNYSTIPTRMAAALLLKRGEISFGEIRALPFVEDEEFVLAIADVLAQNYEVELYERFSERSASQADDVIRLMPPAHVAIIQEPTSPINE